MLSARLGLRPTLLALAMAAGLSCARESAAVAADGGAQLSMPGRIVGKVIHVQDGDTLTVLDAERAKRVVRLTDIDAPESARGAKKPAQPFATQATRALKSLALGKRADAECYETDTRVGANGARRDRYVCRVTVAGVDVNMAMIDAGLAMAYRQNPRYVRDSRAYAREDVARQAGRGIWALAEPVPPWTWRRLCWERGQCVGATK